MASSGGGFEVPEILLTIDADGLPEVPVFTSAAALSHEDSQAAVDLVQVLLRVAVDGSEAGGRGDDETVQLRGAQLIGIIRGLGEWERGFALMAAVDALNGLWQVASFGRTLAEVEQMAAAAGYGLPE